MSHETKTISILSYSQILKIKRSHFLKIWVNAILKLQVACQIGIGNVHLPIVVLILIALVVLRIDFVVHTTESESTVWNFCW